MGIQRTALSFEGKFVQIPNTWARDERISRRARGLLVEVASHRVGWHITTRSLTAAGVEGRDAVRSMIAELVAAGYLEPEQQRAEHGRFGEIEYVLADPFDRDGISDVDDSELRRDSNDPTVAGFSGRGGSTGVGFTGVGLTVDGGSATKNTSVKEHDLEEHELLSGAAVESVTSSGFDDFYRAYPRHEGRAAAERKYLALVKTRKATPAQLIEGARRFAADPNLPEKRFVPHPATWLNQGRWEDEPLPGRGGSEKQQRTMSLIEKYQREEQADEEVRDDQGAGIRAGGGQAGAQRAIRGHVA
jgi:hypothetical protein